MFNFKESLKDWLDWDHAEYNLARALGIMDESVNFCTDAKHIFWTDNPLGNSLHNILEGLSKAGVLEYDRENEKFRWNQSYKGTQKIP